MSSAENPREFIPEKLDSSDKETLIVAAKVVASFNKVSEFYTQADQLRREGNNIQNSIGDILPERVDIPGGYAISIKPIDPAEIGTAVDWTEKLCNNLDSTEMLWIPKWKQYDIDEDLSMDGVWTGGQFLGRSLSFDQDKLHLWAFSDDNKYRVLVDFEIFKMELVKLPVD